MNNVREEYGIERLKEVFLMNKALTHEKLMQTIVSDMKTYCEQTPITDDVTILIIDF